MKTPGHWLRRLVSAGIIVCLTAPCGEAAIVRQQAENAPAVQDQSANATSTNEKPNADLAAPKASADGSAAGGTQSNSNHPSGAASPTQNEQQNPATSQPVGTAAAPLEKTEGIPASRPAGAVVAPAKQRRARSFLIRVSLIVGAAVAIGTVAALSKGSPSRP